MILLTLRESDIDVRPAEATHRIRTCVQVCHRPSPNRLVNPASAQVSSWANSNGPSRSPETRSSYTVDADVAGAFAKACHGAVDGFQASTFRSGSKVCSNRWAAA